MKTKSNKNKVNIVTLGCSKNQVDSEVILSQLRGNKIEATHEDPESNANIVIINTCGFIENAKQESVDTIIRYADAKKEGLIEKVYVTGCLSQRYKDDLKEEIPEVDAFFGTSDLAQLLRRFNATYRHELIGERKSSHGHYAYMKISEGCDRPCSFCAIPLMRGKHVSRKMEDLILEAQNLASKGTKELLLIAQDSTYYGIDIYGKRRLADLLSKISDVEGLEWIRLHYAFPSGFPEDVLEVMASRENICNYIDIPLQHASSNMLKKMRRGISREKTEALLEKIRSIVPGIAIRTTLIAGHPGETEEDFEELKDFVEKVKFERLGIFTYSHEEGTHAYNMPDDVPQEVKQFRANSIMNIQEKISYDLNQPKIGKTYKVLIDRVEGDDYIGRTEFDSPEVDNEVIISSKSDYLRIGDFTEVKITDANEFDLFGIPVTSHN